MLWCDWVKNELSADWACHQHLLVFIWKQKKTNICTKKLSTWQSILLSYQGSTSVSVKTNRRTLSCNTFDTKNTLCCPNDIILHVSWLLCNAFSEKLGHCKWIRLQSFENLKLPFTYGFTVFKAQAILIFPFPFVFQRLCNSFLSRAFKVTSSFQLSLLQSSSSASNHNQPNPPLANYFEVFKLFVIQLSVQNC